MRVCQEMLIYTDHDTQCQILQAVRAYIEGNEAVGSLIIIILSIISVLTAVNNHVRNFTQIGYCFIRR